ncbi:hypothetical protein NLS99_003789, partial [Proteus mirabilis]
KKTVREITGLKNINIFIYLFETESAALSLSPMLAMTCFILDREHIVRIKNNEYHRFVIFGHYQQRQL